METRKQRARGPVYRPGTETRHFIACCGVNGDDGALKRFADMVKRRSPDGVLFAGGIGAGRESTAKEDFLNEFFKELGGSTRFAAIIPSSKDTPLGVFLRVARNAEIVYPAISVVHATSISRGTIAISGLGGIITESEEQVVPELKYSHSSAEYYLRTLWKMDESMKLLLLSDPPDGHLGGSGGNRLVREFVKSFHPYLCVVMGEKKNRGTERVDPHSIIINPGQVSEGSAAWIELSNLDIKMLDF